MKLFDSIARLNELLYCNIKVWWRPNDGYLDPSLDRCPKLFRDVSSATMRFKRRTFCGVWPPSRKDNEVAKVVSCSSSQALRPRAAKRTMIKLMNAEKAPTSLVSSSTEIASF